MSAFLLRLVTRAAGVSPKGAAVPVRAVPRSIEAMVLRDSGRGAIEAKSLPERAEPPPAPWQDRVSPPGPLTAGPPPALSPAAAVVASSVTIDRVAIAPAAPGVGIDSPHRGAAGSAGEGISASPAAHRAAPPDEMAAQQVVLPLAPVALASTLPVRIAAPVSAPQRGGPVAPAGPSTPELGTSIAPSEGELWPEPRERAMPQGPSAQEEAAGPAQPRMHPVAQPRMHPAAQSRMHPVAQSRMDSPPEAVAPLPRGGLASAEPVPTSLLHSAGAPLVTVAPSPPAPATQIAAPAAGLLPAMADKAGDKPPPARTPPPSWPAPTGDARPAPEAAEPPVRTVLAPPPNVVAAMLEPRRASSAAADVPRAAAHLRSAEPPEPAQAAPQPMPREAVPARGPLARETRAAAISDAAPVQVRIGSIEIRSESAPVPLAAPPAPAAPVGFAGYDGLRRGDLGRF